MVIDDGGGTKRPEWENGDVNSHKEVTSVSEG